MATEPEATTQPTLATAVAEVGTAVERHSILWLTNVSHAVNHFQNQMVAVLYVAVMPELGFGPAQLGLLTAVYSMAGGSIQGLYGFVTPFMRRTWILGIGNLVMGAGTLASGFVGSFGAFVGTRGVAAIGASAQHPVGYSLLSGYFPVNRGTIIALNSSASNVGSLLAPLVAAAMLLVMGWREVFMIVAFLSIAMGVVYFLYRNPAAQTNAPAVAAQTTRGKLLQSRASYLRVFKNKNMILVSLVMMVGGAGRGAGVNVAFLGVHLGPGEGNLGMTITMVGFAIAALQIGGVVGPVAMGWLSDKLSRTGVLQSSLFLSALATAWLAFQDAYLPLLFACLIIYGIVTRSRQSLTQAIVADSLPEADHDAAFSVFFFLGFLSGPVWALLVGGIWQYFGFAEAFLMLAASYIVGMLIMLFVVDPRRSQPQAQPA